MTRQDMEKKKKKKKKKRQPGMRCRGSVLVSCVEAYTDGTLCINNTKHPTRHTASPYSKFYPPLCYDLSFMDAVEENGKRQVLFHRLCCATAFRTHECV